MEKMILSYMALSQLNSAIIKGCTQNSDETHLLTLSVDQSSQRFFMTQKNNSSIKGIILVLYSNRQNLK